MHKMGSQETFKIFCGNLSPVTTDSDLHMVFCKHGTVVEAVVMTGKNFGFVHMANEAQGIKALHGLQGHILNGEKMVVQRAINSKKATVSMSVKRNIVGNGVSNLDGFENNYEVNDHNYNYGQDISPILKQPIISSSPISYTNSINPASSSNLSDNSSGRPSPLLISSASSSYTPEHVYQMKTNEKYNHYENVVNQEDKSVCGMCKERFDNRIHLPKILSCNHTFCLDCLTSLTKGSEIKCPHGCPYITTLHESGVSGLTTNQTKTIQNEDVLSNVGHLHDNQKDQLSFQNDVCCMCLCTPPNKLCSVQKHQILRETEAADILKPKLKNLLEFSVNTLRNVMALQATLKERMQYTLHSLNKFSEELKIKIEGEEFEQAMQQSLLADLHEANDTLMSITSINDLLIACNKINSFSQSITAQYSNCYAKDAINDALDSVLLQLKEPKLDTCLTQLGFSREEAFSLTSTLRENADKGNFANVLLIYLLCDLLSTRYRPNLINSQIGFTPYSHSFGNTNSPSLISIQETKNELQNKDISDENDIFDLNKVIETTEAIESSVNINGASNLSERFSPPIVSSALSLGLSNFSLIGPDNILNNDIDNNEENELTNAPRPVSYLDAVKKPAKQSNLDNQSKQLVKSIPSPIKPSKFPHCWMVLSINGVNAGRIIFQLRPDKAPNMCDNFIGLCTGRSGYSYKGTHFFKNGDGFLVGGDVENDDGSGGYSVYDKQKFEADLCPLKDDVGMVRFKGIGTSDKGRGMVGSQFMIWYTEREFKKFSFSLVFGRVVDGLHIVQEAANHNPLKDAIKVEECGAI